PRALGKDDQRVARTQRRRERLQRVLVVGALARDVHRVEDLARDPVLERRGLPVVLRGDRARVRTQIARQRRPDQHPVEVALVVGEVDALLRLRRAAIPVTLRPGDEACGECERVTGDLGEQHQWRKWRVPVSTIAMSRSSAAAITSSSRMLPPGWMTQVAPASHTTSSPSRKGKKASLATAEPARLSPALAALMEAMRAESMRLICPAPTPSVIPSAQKTMALLFTNFATFQANSRSCSCCGVGWRFVTTRSSSARTFCLALKRASASSV